MQELNLHERKLLLDHVLSVAERIPFSTGNGVFNYPILFRGKPKNLSVSLQAQEVDGSVPMHYHFEDCEALIVLLVSNDYGNIFLIPSGDYTISYVGVGADTKCHEWAATTVLVLSIKGADFMCIQRHLRNPAFQKSLEKAIHKLAE